MRVLHIIPSVAPIRGGTSLAVLDMVRGLQTQGIDVEIATTNDDGDNVLDQPLGQRVIYRGVPTYFFPRFSPSISTLREFAFSSSLTIWLIKNISKYDLIHVHAIFSYTSTVAMAIATWQGIPYLTTLHGLLCKWSLQQSTQRKQIYLQLIERVNLNRAQAIHLTCEQEQQDFQALNFKSSTFVLPLALPGIPAQIPNASALLRQNLNCLLDEPIILFLARIHHKKGLEYLIPALSKLIHHRFTFVLAGNGAPEYVEEINSLLVSAGIRDRTHMIGFVEGEPKNILLQGADLFTLTSHSENFGIAALEALSVGLPVLLTPGVALSSIVKEHKLGYVIDLDVAAIAQTIELHLINLSDETKNNSSLRISQFVRDNYTWDKVSTKLIEIYQDILEQKSINLKVKNS